MRNVALLALFAGCYQQYYVADVHTEGGELVQTKCAIDGHGDATRWCHDEPVEAADAEYTGTPDPAEVRQVRRELAASQPAPRPAPNEAAILGAVNARGVHRLVELCKRTYARDTTTLSVSLAVSPDGAVTATPHADGQFADCAAHALATANIAPFDGDPVRVDEQLAID
jgi:hypothetical protein